MSRNRFRKVLPSLLAVLLLAAQAAFLAVPVGAAPPVHSVNADQQTAITLGMGAGAPHGTWESRLEIAEFFFRADRTLSTPGQPGVGIAPGDDPEPGQAVYQMTLEQRFVPATLTQMQNRAVVIGSGAPQIIDGLVFPHYQQVSFFAEVNPALDDLQIFALSIDLYMAGLAPNGRGVARVFEIDANGDRVRWLGPGNCAMTNENCVISARLFGQTPSTTVPGVMHYRGELSLGTEGITLPKGHSLEVLVGTAYEAVGQAPGPPAVLYFDTTTFPSKLNVRADSARINIWTETAFGEVRNSFPSPNVDASTPADVFQRRVEVKLLHVNAWGPDQFDLPGRGVHNLHRLELRDLDRQRNIEINAAFKDWPTTMQPCAVPPCPPAQTGTQALDADPNLGGLNTVRLYTYTLVYPAGFDGGDPITPDGLYRFEVRQLRQGWDKVYQPFFVGQHGFQMCFAPGEELFAVVPGDPEAPPAPSPLCAGADVPHIVTHKVLAPGPLSPTGEATVFALDLQNTGPSQDLIGVAAPVTGGWGVQISNTQVSLNAGDTQRVYVTVTPPSNALDGDTRIITVTAASLVSNQVKSLQMIVDVVSEPCDPRSPDPDTDLPIPCVALSTPLHVVETRPLVTESFFVQILNLQPQKARYIVTAVNVPEGWAVNLSPPVQDVFASSRVDVLVQVTAPSWARAGDGFTLQLRVVDAADEEIQAIRLIPVTVYALRGVLMDLAGPDEKFLRDQGPPRCADADPFCIIGLLPVFTDTKFDRSSLARFRLTNTGDVDQDMRMQGFWTVPTGNIACDNGIPAGWSFNRDKSLGGVDAHGGAMDSPIGSPNPPRGHLPTSGFSGLYELGTVTVPAGTERDFYMEFGYMDPVFDACSAVTGFQNVAMQAGFTVIASAADDATVRAVESVLFSREPAGGQPIAQNVYPGATHAVAIDMGANSRAEGFVLQDGVVVYNVIARNEGNQPDTLHVSVAPGQEGWIHTLVFPPDETKMFTPQGPGEDALLTPLFGLPTPLFGSSGDGQFDEVRQAGCTNPGDNPRGFTCYLGVQDEILFQVVVRPPPTARVGDYQTAVMEVVSGTNGNIFDSKVLLTTVTAPFEYLVEGRVNTLDIEFGKTASFPYTVKNIGLMPDNYVFSVGSGAPAGWNPRVSETSRIHIPGQLDHHGFLTVRAPEDAEVGEVYHFRVEVESLGDLFDPTDNQRKVVDFFAKVIDTREMWLQAEPALIQPGGQVRVAVEAFGFAAGGEMGLFRINPNHLPRGWSVASVDGTLPIAEGQFNEEQPAPRARVEFDFTAPPMELSTSRIAVRVNMTTEPGEPDTRNFAITDLQLDLGTVFGLTINRTTSHELVVPGFSVEHIVEVKNNGLTEDEVNLHASGVPAGWEVTFPEPAFRLHPLEKRQAIAVVTAPGDLSPGARATFVLSVHSVGDPSKTASVTLVTEVGRAELEALLKAEGVQYLAPEETARFVVTVTNLGNLHDKVRLDGLFGAQTFGTQPSFVPQTPEFTLAPGQSRDVVVNVTMPRLVASGTQVPLTIVAQSAFPGIIGQTSMTAQILDHQGQDVTGDGRLEYAVNRDRDPSTGFEQFRASTLPGGIDVQVPPLARYLRSDAYDAKQAAGALFNTAHGEQSYFIDGNNDGRAEHFLDTSGDGLPNLYWNPDLRYVTPLNISMDVTGNGIREYFIDINGDGLLDVWFELATGLFGQLIQVDLDGDGVMDYVVDLNRNGRIDDHEPVLYARTGGFLFVQKIDVTGNGCADQVFDLDGNGRPAYFIASKRNSAGVCEPDLARGSIPFVLRDVTGDGVLDWTYASREGGRVDSYYDPATGEVGTIDTLSVFARSLVTHWYVGLLFLVVAGLFVALMLATRRR